jgi:DNA-binding MarR family transcriptional regulator
MSVDIKTDVVIELLAKLAIGETKIKNIVTKNKQNPHAYIKGYNACNGKNGVTDISRIVGVKSPTITPILKAWEKEGIVYNIGTETKPKYKSLMRIK